MMMAKKLVKSAVCIFEACVWRPIEATAIFFGRTIKLRLQKGFDLGCVRNLVITSLTWPNRNRKNSVNFLAQDTTAFHPHVFLVAIDQYYS